jgi:hypothetical protein
LPIRNAPRRAKGNDTETFDPGLARARDRERCCVSCRAGISPKEQAASYVERHIERQAARYIERYIERHVEGGVDDQADTKCPCAEDHRSA